MTFQLRIKARVEKRYTDASPGLMSEAHCCGWDPVSPRCLRSVPPPSNVRHWSYKAHWRPERAHKKSHIPHEPDSLRSASSQTTGGSLMRKRSRERCPTLRATGQRTRMQKTQQTVTNLPDELHSCGRVSSVTRLLSVNGWAHTWISDDNNRDRQEKTHGVRSSSSRLPEEIK